MLKINKIKNENEYDKFIITTKEGEFSIAYGGTLDLYWSYIPTESLKELPDSKTFTITKENYELYQLMNELYERIKEKQPLKEKEEQLPEFMLGLNLNTNRNERNWEKLFHNDMIEWYSEDSINNKPCKLQIKQILDAYKITFYKGKIDTFPTYTIRFSNNGSQYDPYNTVFMNMYNELREIDPNYHQIHMEEYLYHQKTLQKRKK